MAKKKSYTHTNRKSRKVSLKRAMLKALQANRGIITRTIEFLNKSGIKVERKTFYDYQKEDPEFAQAVLDIEEHVLDLSEEKLHNLIDNEEPSAIYFHLKCKGKRRGYIEKQAIEMEHKGLPQKMVIGGQEIDFS